MREYLGVCRGRLGEDGYCSVNEGGDAVCYKLTAGETCPTCRDLPPVSPVPFLAHPVCFLETAHHWKQAGTPAHPDKQHAAWRPRIIGSRRGRLRTRTSSMWHGDSVFLEAPPYHLLPSTPPPLPRLPSLPYPPLPTPSHEGRGSSENRSAFYTTLGLSKRK